MSQRTYRHHKVTGRRKKRIIHAWPDTAGAFALLISAGVIGGAFGLRVVAVCRLLHTDSDACLATRSPAHPRTMILHTRPNIVIRDRSHDCGSRRRCNICATMSSARSNQESGSSQHMETKPRACTDLPNNRGQIFGMWSRGRATQTTCLR